MKPVKAWALFTKRGYLATLSGQLPIFWYREAAEREQAKWPDLTVRVVEVALPLSGGAQG